MAATVTLHGETVLLLNIYAPSTVLAREAFYSALPGLLPTHDGPIICGGDFNCTLNQHTDRTYNNHKTVHDSKQLRKMLKKLNLVDTLEDDATQAHEARDVQAFHRQHHTYFYSLPTGGSASSRLDRWYCSNEHLDWIHSVSQHVAGPYSDHNGVTTRVAPPDKLVQSKKPRMVYPLPQQAAPMATAVATEFFELAHAQLDQLQERHVSTRDYAQATALWWDEAETKLRIKYLDVKKQYINKAKQGFKKKIQRLHRCLLDKETQLREGSESASDEIADGWSQELTWTVTSIRKAIAECKTKWQIAKRQRLFRDHMYQARRSSKSFYRRISTKFLDNTIFSLEGTASYSP
jgi:hypothetical protein